MHRAHMQRLPADQQIVPLLKSEWASGGLAILVSIAIRVLPLFSSVKQQGGLPKAEGGGSNRPKDPRVLPVELL
jgi:hypothetical protein